MKKEMKMEYISFTHVDGRTGRVVEIKNPTGTTWMDLADDFVGFLTACGYVVNREDVAMHLTDDNHSLADFHTDQLDLTLYDQLDTMTAGSDTLDIR